MYYRYKSKKSSKKLYIIVFWLVLISTVGYMGYSYQQYILFWKYSYSMLEQRLEDARQVQNADHRSKQLKDTRNAISKYVKNNPYSSDAYFLLGSCYYHYGAAVMDMQLTEMFDQASVEKNVTPESREAFIDAIKHLNKGIALGGKTAINDSQRMALAKALYYMSYYSIDDIYQCAAKILTPNKTLSYRDVRFYSLLAIKNGKSNEGIQLLKAAGNIYDSVDGQLFLASAYLHANQFTNAIMEYKNILDKSQDSNTIKDVHVALGKIYFSRSLYSASLEHFQNALKIDAQDSRCKIWIGKNYSAMGYKSRARSTWSEVLVTDSDNKEAKKLLNLM